MDRYANSAKNPLQPEETVLGDISITRSRIVLALSNTRTWMCSPQGIERKNHNLDLAFTFSGFRSITSLKSPQNRESSEQNILNPFRLKHFQLLPRHDARDLGASQ
jgi:hypothetical protein